MRRAVLLALAAWACGAGMSRAAGDAAIRTVPDADGAAPVHACPRDPRVTVRSPAGPDAVLACEGATRALDFLARAGLDGAQGTSIEIVPELHGDLAGRAVGCYMRDTHRIFLVGLETFRAGGGWFGMPPSVELYRAAASHEIAHAVVGCRSVPNRLPVAAHEYVAYVVFFATMDPRLRADILARFPGAGFRTAGQISDVAHLANPNRFGVDAWRHYLRVGDRGRWLREVVAGEGVPEPGRDPDAASR